MIWSLSTNDFFEKLLFVLKMFLSFNSIESFDGELHENSSMDETEYGSDGETLLSKLVLSDWMFIKSIAFISFSLWFTKQKELFEKQIFLFISDQKEENIFFEFANIVDGTERHWRLLRHLFWQLCELDLRRTAFIWQQNSTSADEAQSLLIIILSDNKAETRPNPRALAQRQRRFE